MALRRGSQNVFVSVIVFVFVFVVVFLLVRSCFLIALIKCLKDCSLKVFFKCICHCLCICLCLRRCLFVGQVMFSHHSDQMSQRSKVSGVAIWGCSPSPNVIVIVFVFVIVIVFLFVRSCLLVTLITCLKGHKSLRVLYGSVFQQLTTDWLLTHHCNGE